MFEGPIESLDGTVDGIDGELLCENTDRDIMAEEYAKILLGNCDGDVEHVASDAYYVADQMIAERRKRR